MVINQKYLKEIRQLLGVYIILSLIWSIPSILSAKPLSIDPVVIIFGLQGYFVYLISRDKVKVVQRTLLCFISTYLGISIFDWLNIHRVSVTIPFYLVMLAIGIGLYVYLRVITKKEEK